MERIDPNHLSWFITEPIYVVNEPAPFFTEEVVEPEAEVNEELPVLDYKGENRKEILILVDEKNKPYLSEKDETFLTKILGATGLTFTDIALLNLHSLREQIEYFPDVFQLLHDFPFRTLILFGNIPETLPFTRYLNKYQIVQDDLEKTYLQADALKEIANDRSKKQLLWRNLQDVFAV